MPNELNANFKVVATEVHNNYRLILTLQLQNGLRVFDSDLVELSIDQVPDADLRPDNPEHYNHFRFHGYLMVSELGIPGAHYHANDSELLVFTKGSAPKLAYYLLPTDHQFRNVLDGTPLTDINHDLYDYAYYEPLEDGLAGALDAPLNESNNFIELLSGYITYLNDRFPV